MFHAVRQRYSAGSGRWSQPGALAEACDAVNPLELVELPALMEISSGQPEVVVGLLDGPVEIDHPDLNNESIRSIGRDSLVGQAGMTGFAAAHGTFVAGILSAKRGSGAPGICPDCTLLVRPIFEDASQVQGRLPRATVDGLIAAISEVVDRGARIINLSATLDRLSEKQKQVLIELLDHALRRGIIVVAAAGNQGVVGSSVITRHPAVIPVVAYDLNRRPIGLSNFSSTIGRRGLGGPGAGVSSLGESSRGAMAGGTSVAAPFVTGAAALVWSEFPEASAREVIGALRDSGATHRHSIVPPLMDAWAAYQITARSRGRSGRYDRSSQRSMSQPARIDE